MLVTERHEVLWFANVVVVKANLALDTKVLFVGSDNAFTNDTGNKAWIPLSSLNQHLRR